MPLLDHFHPPLSERRHWDSLHANWSTRLADALTVLLPADYVAEEQCHAFGNMEIDVAAYEEKVATNGLSRNGPAASTQTVATWTPPAAAYNLPAIFPDSFEVRVFSMMAGRTLVAAIELVSPGNKDRPDARRAFVAKCASYLQQGISVIVMDIVTSLRANLHNELLQLLELGEQHELPKGEKLYAVAYRPVQRQERPEIDVWPATFAVGDLLPTLPLRLTGDQFVPVDFEAAYQEACQRRRLP